MKKNYTSKDGNPCFLNIKRVLLSLIFLSFMASGQLMADRVSDEGTDFWVSCGNNSLKSYTEISLQIRIVAKQNAIVTFSFTELDASSSVIVPAGTVYTKVLTAAEARAIYSNASGTTEKSVHIQSTTPVAVYVLNQCSATTDATGVLPTRRLRSDYYQISYAANLNGRADGYTIVAPEDDTEIFENGISKATLQRGEVYTFYAASADIDLTGTRITSTKPIAHFVTMSGINLPINYTASDIMYQQMMPVETWGKEFLVPVSTRGTERVRIVASQDGTTITQTGGVIKTNGGGSLGGGTGSLTLNAGQFVELEIKLATLGCFITSNKPVGVCSYMPGINYVGSSKSGDPSIAWIPPVEQMIEQTTIAPFIPNGITQLNKHYAIITTKTDTKGQTTVATATGSPLPLSGDAWYDNTAGGYSFYLLPLTNTTYTFANPAGLTAMGYGTGQAESYYYMAGAALRVLSSAFYVNDIHYQELDGTRLCSDPYTFRAEVEGTLSSNPGNIKWYINGVEQTSARDQLEWTSSLADGTYEVRLETIDLSDEVVTRTATFEVNCTLYAEDDVAEIVIESVSPPSVTIDVLANDDFMTCDPTGATLTIDPATQPVQGMATVTNDGKITYAPKAGFIGSDTFNYTVTCGGASSTATVRVDVLLKPVLSLRDSCSSAPKLSVEPQYVGVAYQWYRSADGGVWNAISGANAAEVKVTEAGFYKAIITSSGGTSVETPPADIVLYNRVLLPGNVRWYQLGRR